MAKQEKCKKAEEYGYPYQNKCKNRWRNIESDNISYLIDSNYFYETSKKLSKTTKIWFRHNDNGKVTMYRCYPATDKISQTFYELEKSELISKLKKDVLNTI